MPFVRQCCMSLSDQNIASLQDVNKLGSSGYPAGVGVDELHHYGRKRTLGLTGLEDHFDACAGSCKTGISEYKRCYKNYFLKDKYPLIKNKNSVLSPLRAKKPEDTWIIDEFHEMSNSCPDFFKDHMFDGVVTHRLRNSDGEVMDVDYHVHDRFSTEVQSKYITHKDLTKTKPIKRAANLKIEGDLLTTTEKADKFIEYLLVKRERLIKKPTTLRLEGDMEKTTENREQFIPYEYQERPPLMKKSTNLHMEGERIITTENHDQFIPHKVHKRQPFTKMSTNLHLEGDLDMHPEYRDAFVGYNVVKQIPTLPSHNLKIDGTYNIDTETKSKEFSHPPIPFLRSGDKKLILGDDKAVKYPEYKEKYVEYPRMERSVMRRPETHLQPRGDMQTVTENKLQFVEKRSPKAERRRASTNLKLEGNIDMTPEYKNAYVDFYRDGGRSPVKRRAGRSSNLRNEGDMDINPEYRSSFINFPRERPHIKRPEGQLTNEGDMHHTTEKRAVYIQHQAYNKSEAVRREPELKLEGNFVCQPEYRKAYIDYLIRERVERKPRPLDNLGALQKRASELMQVKDKTPDSKKVEHVINKPEVREPRPSTSGMQSQIPVAAKKSAASSSSDDQMKPPASAKSTSSSSTAKSRQKPLSSRLPLLKKSPVPSATRLTVTNSTSSSRNISPVPFSTTRRRSKSTTPRNKSKLTPRIESSEPRHHSRVGSRFPSPIKVEDLAYQPCVSPIPRILRSIPPETERRPRSRQEDTAFVILDKEVNNNCACEDGGNSLYKEQRWMSSWYSPPH